MKRITPIFIIVMKSLEWADAAWNIIVAYDNETDAHSQLDRLRRSADSYEYRIRQADLLTDI